MNATRADTDVEARGKSRVAHAQVGAWVSEFTGTAVLLLTSVGVTRFVFASPFADPGPSFGVRLAVVGVFTGAVLAVLIASPMGHISGGHFNPAVSITFWLLGRLPAANAVAYVAMQLLGSILGVATARAALGPVVSGSRVDYAVIRPSHGWTNAASFTGEALMLAGLMALVLTSLSRPQFAHRTPLVAGATVCILIIVGGFTSGGSFNPARQIGPLLFAGEPSLLWPYLLGPVVGAIGIAEPLRLAGLGRSIPCGLCGEQPAHLRDRDAREGAFSASDRSRPTPPS